MSVAQDAKTEEKKAKRRAQYLKHKTKENTTHKIYYKTHKEQISTYQKTYREKHKDEIKKKKKEYLESHREENKIKCKKYRESHKAEIAAAKKKWELLHINDVKQKKHSQYVKNKEAIDKQHKEYFKKHPDIYRKVNLNRSVKRRELGYMPMNSAFKGSHFHHMHLTNADGTKNKAIGIHIPAKLHKSVYHNHRTGEGMAEINKRALKWFTIMQRRLK